MCVPTEQWKQNINCDTRGTMISFLMVSPIISNTITKICESEDMQFDCKVDDCSRRSPDARYPGGGRV